MHYAQITLKGLMFLPKSSRDRAAIIAYRIVRTSIGATLLVFAVSVATVIAGFAATGGTLSADNTNLLQFAAGMLMVFLGGLLLSLVGTVTSKSWSGIKAMREDSRVIDLRNDYFGIGLRRAIFFGDFALENFDHQREVLSGVLANKLAQIVENNFEYDRLHMLGTLESAEACAELAQSLQYVVADIQRSVALRVQPYLDDERTSREALAELNELTRVRELKQVRQKTSTSSANLQRVHNG